MRNILRCALFLMALNFSCRAPLTHENPEPYAWRIMATPTEGSLRGLSPLTEEITWVTGSNGLWMLTLDAGKSWQHGIIDGLDTVDFRDIEGMNASTAVAISAGQPAVIYKTTDGGKSWIKTYEGRESDFFNCLAFRDERVGYAYGDPVNKKWTILKTSDGGDTWRRLEKAPSAIDGEAGFAASGSVLVVDDEELWLASGGAESNVYYSKTSGDQWALANTPILQGEPSQGIFSMTLIDNRNLIAVGGDYTEPDKNEKNVTLSHDDGLTWVVNEGTPPSGYRSGVVYYPRYHWVVAVGPNGSDFSRDGGEHWQRFSEEGFHAVKISKSGGSIWASGSNGRVALLDFEE
jgi:photosystem II stability/assembly factor-like uncharacterized protein